MRLGAIDEVIQDLKEFEQCWFAADGFRLGWKQLDHVGS